MRIARRGKKSIDSEYLIQDPGSQAVLAFGDALLVPHISEQVSSIPSPESWCHKIIMFEGI